MRTDFDPGRLGPRDFYKFLTSVVVPRPIAWVSSTSAAGVDNLAPHSFFTVASVDPPVVQFTSVGEKDSLRNIEATGEFVVNLAPASLIQEVNATGTNFSADVDEFDAAGLSREPSTVVRPPRVKESPAVLECTLHQTIRVGDCVLVLGLVVHGSVSSRVLKGSHPDAALLDPLSRLGGDEWATLGPIQDLPRIRASQWPGSFRPQGGQEGTLDSDDYRKR
ncbi:flavin reductase family protein [Pseudarthrobacter enclensis]|uniref:Flavin reductase (DIM6/NTAB) family NADH-FMN oxidoreductase RutF n=1 Tax=Pseudarthrobacter enclensis TaxID=993070 RepID=A0ABT9RT31_9MICC|nr:flavin reductase family protein [Pseudarthrobacter enclensis]MDP9887798.1 flavin reductase (DIM6/NTAB) family NADH-FMN oxidoreductase RutF [Pseudarthrobacter enclensis]